MNPKQAAIEQLRSDLLINLPPVYEQFLLSNAGEVRDDGLLLYSAADILERNTTFAVQQSTPQLLAVGDDSGGRLIVIHHSDRDAVPFVIDSGALTPNMPSQLLRQLGSSWSSWAATDFSLSITE